MNASITVVGCGIKFLSHLTIEAKASIEQADILLYLVNEPAMKEWLRHANSNAQSLDHLYFLHKKRIDNYKEITNYILSILQKNLHVCVVLYGHPTVFAKPALDAVLKARILGYETKILPGISTEACLFADLSIDPGTDGCLSYEATDMLIHKKNINPSVHLIIWQISAIGAIGHINEHDNTQGINILTDYLSNYYNLNHKVTLYSAAQYPSFDPIIQHMELFSLPNAKILPITTLYIPPSIKVHYDIEMLSKLGLNVADLG